MSIANQIILYFESISFSENPLAILDIILVGIIIYWVINRIKSTKAVRILWGLIFLVILYFIALALNLLALIWILKGFFAVLIVALPVVFQPELRRLLEKLGQQRFWKAVFSNSKSKQVEKTFQEIAKACETLAKTKTGALIVLKQKDDLAEYAESGIILNAEVTSELLLNIFFPKSPLHDGAVIIGENKIISASSILPLTDKEKGYTFGTRHRAAIGLAQECDAIIIVVSEERGTITVAFHDQLIEKIPPKDLINLILKLSK